MRSLRCENRERCLTAYRNVDFAPLSQGNLTCPECGSPLIEPPRFRSRKQTILFAVQIVLLTAGALSLIYLSEEVANLYSHIQRFFR